ncbi:MAG: hypothetical protein ACE5KA_00720 [Nitrososphaerales archaeon]
MSHDEQFPVKGYDRFEQKAIDRYAIYKSGRHWIALVVEANSKKELRLYSWEFRKDTWKVALASQNADFWNWEELASRVKKFKHRYNINSS